MEAETEVEVEVVMSRHHTSAVEERAYLWRDVVDVRRHDGLEGRLTDARQHSRDDEQPELGRDAAEQHREAPDAAQTSTTAAWVG
jgi:hypothetical protein